MKTSIFTMNGCLNKLSFGVNGLWAGEIYITFCLLWQTDSIRKKRFNNNRLYLYRTAQLVTLTILQYGPVVNIYTDILCTNTLIADNKKYLYTDINTYIHTLTHTYIHTHSISPTYADTDKKLQYIYELK